MYIISYPSGKITKDGVIIEQDSENPAWREYSAWLAADNGPEVGEPDFIAIEPPDVRAEQVSRVLQDMLGMTEDQAQRLLQRAAEL